MIKYTLAEKAIREGAKKAKNRQIFSAEAVFRPVFRLFAGEKACLGRFCRAFREGRVASKQL
jgi:hypothetical protein